MAKKKPNGLERLALKTFIDGHDSYSDEYQRWKTYDIVKRLVGVFEVPDEVFAKGTIEDKLAAIGYGHYSVIRYESEFDSAPSEGNDPTVGTGCAMVVQDTHGRLRPLVMVRKEVRSSEAGNEIQDGIRLLVLMHELGHADDIVRGINYDHESKKVNVIDAEVYAHQFVCKHARRLNYRLALGYYVENLEQHVTATNEVSRLSAVRALETLDLPALKAAASMEVFSSHASMRRMLEKAGRLNDVLERAAEHQSMNR